MTRIVVRVGEVSTVDGALVESIDAVSSSPIAVIDVRKVTDSPADAIGKISWAIAQNPGLERVVIMSPQSDDLIPYLEYLS